MKKIERFDFDDYFDFFLLKVSLALCISFNVVFAFVTLLNNPEFMGKTGVLYFAATAIFGGLILSIPLVIIQVPFLIALYLLIWMSVRLFFIVKNSFSVLEN